MSFSKNLNRLMKARGWTTSAHLVAAMADNGVHATTWSADRWLAGQNTPRAHLIPHIAKALGVEPNELFADSPDPVASAVNE
ncbi:MAG: helix-turn-helix domain-containing protein [Candidatus Hydrogenedentes bacterium]|nr:helix-turn-helix domain-containing protein [Candidatus Hydrogenedentota bacterium]